MKKITGNILLFIFIMLTGMSGYAVGVTPPHPDQASASLTVIPPTPETPIDENLILLGFTALLFGSYTIYKSQKPIKKTSN